jgi:hypothetical protein
VLDEVEEGVEEAVAADARVADDRATADLEAVAPAAPTICISDIDTSDSS